MADRVSLHQGPNNERTDSSPQFADESEVSSEAGGAVDDDWDGETGDGRQKFSSETEKLLKEAVKNQNLMLEEFEFIQQEQRAIKERLEVLEKEQEKFHIGGYKRMDQGFKNVSKCLKQMEGMNEVFKEVIGIISGERIRFIDHSNESLNSHDARTAVSSSLLEVNGIRSNGQGSRNANSWSDMMSRDRTILEGNMNSRIKQETQSVWDLPPPSDAAHGEPVHGSSLLRDLGSGNEAGDYPPALSTGRGRSNIENINDGLQNRDDGRANEGVDGGVANGGNDVNNNTYNGFVQRYRMNRAIKTVTDLAREYYEGLPGQPSVMALERRFGSTWRSSAGERTFFHKRYVIIQRIENVINNPAKYNLPHDITRRKAVKVIENIRVGNNTYNSGAPCFMTLAQLYLYFSKHMDTVADYSLDLKHKDVPSIREIKSRQKKNMDATIEDCDEISSIVA